MNCDVLVELISAHIDGETSAAERSIVEQHLRNCLPCRRRLAASEALTQELRIAGRSHLSDATRDGEVLTLLRGEGLCGPTLPLTRTIADKAQGDGFRRWPFPLPPILLSLFPLRGMAGGMRAALVAMVAGFVFTSVTLRWADAGPAALTASLPTRAARGPGLVLRDGGESGKQPAPTLAVLLRESQEIYRQSATAEGLKPMRAEPEASRQRRGSTTPVHVHWS